MKFGFDHLISFHGLCSACRFSIFSILGQDEFMSQQGENAFCIVKSELFRATFIAPFEIRLDKRVPQNAAIIGL